MQANIVEHRLFAKRRKRSLEFVTTLFSSVSGKFMLKEIGYYPRRADKYALLLLMGRYGAGSIKNGEGRSWLH